MTIHKSQISCPSQRNKSCAIPVPTQYQTSNSPDYPWGGSFFDSLLPRLLARRRACGRGSKSQATPRKQTSTAKSPKMTMAIFQRTVAAAIPTVTQIQTQAGNLCSSRSSCGSASQIAPRVRPTRKSMLAPKVELVSPGCRNAIAAPMRKARLKPPINRRRMREICGSISATGLHRKTGFAGE